ncbi:hypothetical protein F652_846 [Enterobacteriaceae bacterium bta3-1]|nr:hypothetical protein F652_846 [Enterobacteriaceae bacterium bta3-1]
MPLEPTVSCSLHQQVKSGNGKNLARCIVYELLMQIIL